MHIQPSAFETAGKKAGKMLAEVGKDLETRTSHFVEKQAAKVAQKAKVNVETKPLPLNEIPTSSLEAFYGPIH